MYYKNVLRNTMNFSLSPNVSTKPSTVSSPFSSSFCSVLKKWSSLDITLQWRHNGRDSVSNHQPHDCFLNRLFRHRSKKTSKLRVTGLCAGNSPEAGKFPAQMASNAENVSIRWRHHELITAIIWEQISWLPHLLAIIKWLRLRQDGKSIISAVILW